MTGHAPPRSLTAFLPVAGDPAMLARAMAQDPQGWLPEGACDGQDRWRLTTQCADGAHSVSLRISQPWWSADTLWRTVSWNALDASNQAHGGCPQLSALDGELGLHASPGAVSLILDVRYTPSAAGVGAPTLHRVVRSTSQQLLVDIAAGLTRATHDVDVPAAAAL